MLGPSADYLSTLCSLLLTSCSPSLCVPDILRHLVRTAFSWCVKKAFVIHTLQHFRFFFVFLLRLCSSSFHFVFHFSYKIGRKLKPLNFTLRNSHPTFQVPNLTSMFHVRTSRTRSRRRRDVLHHWALSTHLAHRQRIPPRARALWKPPTEAQLKRNGSVLNDGVLVLALVQLSCEVQGKVTDLLDGGVVSPCKLVGGVEEVPVLASAQLWLRVVLFHFGLLRLLCAMRDQAPNERSGTVAWKWKAQQQDHHVSSRTSAQFSLRGSLVHIGRVGPRVARAHSQPATHLWSLLQCAAPGRSSQGTRGFLGLTANRLEAWQKDRRGTETFDE